MPFCSSLTLSLFMCDSGGSFHPASIWQRRVPAAAGPGRGRRAGQPAAPARHTDPARPGGTIFNSDPDLNSENNAKYRGEFCLVVVGFFFFFHLLQYPTHTKASTVKYIYGKITFVSARCRLSF